MIGYDPKDPFSPLAKKLAIILDRKLPEGSKFSAGEVIDCLEQYSEKHLCRVGLRFIKGTWMIGRIIINNKTETWTSGCSGRDLFEMILDFIVRDYEKDGHRLKDGAG